MLYSDIISNEFKKHILLHYNNTLNAIDYYELYSKEIISKILITYFNIRKYNYAIGKTPKNKIENTIKQIIIKNIV